MGGERYRVLFEQLGDIGLEKGKGIRGITAGVLVLLGGYKDRRNPEALAKLSGRDEGFGDEALHLEPTRSLLPLLERAHEAGEGMTDEEVLDGVLALGRACARMDERDGCLYCFEMAKEGLVQLFGEDHANSVDITYQLVIQATEGDGLIAELRALWERVKVSLPDKSVMYHIANDLGSKLNEKGQYEEAKVFSLAAFEGRDGFSGRSTRTPSLR